MDIINGTQLHDAGNTQGLATHFLGAGKSNASGSVGGTDANDYYKFVAFTSGTVSVALTGLSGDLDLHLRDHFGAELDSSTHSGMNRESLTFPVIAGQDYYVQVAPATLSQPSANYKLAVTLPDIPPPDPSATDAGDSAGTASILHGSGSQKISGSVGATDTNDYYKFTATVSGQLDLSLTGLKADIDLRLLDGLGFEVGNSRYGGTHDDSLTFYCVEAGHTYYVQVDPYGDAISSYNLELTLPADASSGKVPATSGEVLVVGVAAGSAPDLIV